MQTPKTHNSSSADPVKVDAERDQAPHCFAAGTKIATVRGEVAVQDLQAGDIVLTMDSGLKPIQWIGGREVSGLGKFAPIRFQAGAIGNVRDLVVSPMHRILVRGLKANPGFGESEMLVPARQLVDGDQIIIDPVDRVEYFHILFDQHELVFSDGAATESFYPGAKVLREDVALRLELQTLFPGLFSPEAEGFSQTARLVVDYPDAAAQRAA